MFRYYRDGRRRRVTIVRLGPGFTFDRARRKAISLRGQVQDGADPARDRERRREALTFAEAAERYMTEVAGPYLEASTVVGYWSLMRRHLLPALGRMRLDDIDRGTVIRLHARIGEKAKTAANRARSLLSSVFTATEEWGLREPGTNPCHGTRKNREHRDTRHLTPEERGRLDEALRQAEAATKGTPRYVAPGSVKVARLLLLTGARRGEIVGLEWSMVHLDGPDGPMLRLPRSKTGPKTIQLSTAAVTYLRQLAAARDPESPMVCPGETGGRLTNIWRAWKSIRTHAGLPDVKMHHLRHSFATDAIRAGVSLPVLQRLLGHERLETTARYIHVLNESLREGADMAGAAVVSSTHEGLEHLRQQRAVGDEQGEGGATVIPMNGNVIPFPGLRQG